MGSKAEVPHGIPLAYITGPTTGMSWPLWTTGRPTSTFQCTQLPDPPFLLPVPPFLIPGPPIWFVFSPQGLYKGCGHPGGLSTREGTHLYPFLDNILDKDTAMATHIRESMRNYLQQHSFLINMEKSQLVLLGSQNMHNPSLPARGQATKADTIGLQHQTE